jgi:hypothetical protein
MGGRRKTPCCPHLRNPVAPNRHTSGTPAALPDHAPCGLLLALGTGHHSTRRQALDLDQLGTGQANSASASTCQQPDMQQPGERIRHDTRPGTGNHVTRFLFSRWCGYGAPYLPSGPISRITIDNFDLSGVTELDGSGCAAGQAL